MEDVANGDSISRDTEALGARPARLVGSLVAALVAGAGVVLLSIAASHWIEAFLRCDSGFSGLGCAIVGGGIELAGLLVAGAGLDMLVLAVFRVRRWS